MPRSQPSTVEKLTGDFLKLAPEEQKTVLGVFGAIVKVGATSRPTPGQSVSTPTPAPTPVAPRRRQRRCKPVQPALVETEQYAEAEPAEG